MKREELIKQVKEEYLNIASAESQQHFHETAPGLSANAYYEKLLNSVIKEISRGTFDGAQSADEIVRKVAADKSVLADWK